MSEARRRVRRALQRLHPEDWWPRGPGPIDAAFEARWSEWRVELAKEIFRHGKIRDAEALSGASQRILERMLFARLCEELACRESRRLDRAAAELLAGIHERFLGRRLRVVGRGVRDELAPVLQRAGGAVYTPAWLVGRVVGRTLEPLTRNADPEAILALRILDPACGAGGFLLGAYDHLERAVLGWARANPEKARRERLVRDGAEGLRLTAGTSLGIVGRLHGVDVDPGAVDAARMSLALRHLERSVGDRGGGPRRLLAEIGRNVRLGDSLVEPDAAADGGFHAVVGNPPYVEARRYRESMPGTYRHLKESGRYVTAGRGKTDVALPFMEMAARRLGPGGRLGLVVQNRFFKTGYGEPARRWLRSSRLLEAVEDFRDLQVFPGRTTYTAILVLRAGSPSFEYRAYETLADARSGRPALKVRTGTALLGDGPWSLDRPDLLEVHAALAERHGTIARHRDLEISVGLQTLYGKVYQLEPLEVTSRSVRGVNGLGAEAVLEREALRPLCRNRGFHPFRSDNADAWVVFPYDVEGDRAAEIRWPEFERRFPRAAAYLKLNRRTLREAVEMEAGRDRWHLYTRPQNLVKQARPKVLFPMTIEDTVAAVDARGDVYQDNANVSGLSVRGGAVDLHAVAAVFNSSLFSALARLGAGLNDSGWRKFNRQFAELVPFPLEGLRSGPLARRLSVLASSIEGRQRELVGARGEGRRGAVRRALSALWRELDDAVEELYGLTPGQRKVVALYPRKVDRVELHLRPEPPARGGDGKRRADGFLPRRPDPGYARRRWATTSSSWAAG